MTASSDRRSSAWAQNLALVIAMLGVAGSIVVAVVSEHLRRESQTELLRRDAYEEFAAAARDVDDALRDYATAIVDDVEAAVAYKADQTDIEREEWRTAQQAMYDANDTVETEWDEMIDAADGVRLIGSSEAISARFEVVDAADGREDALGEIRRQLTTPNVLQWEPNEQVLAFKDAHEDAQLVQRFTESLESFIRDAQGDVNQPALE